MEQTRDGPPGHPPGIHPGSHLAARGCMIVSQEMGFYQSDSSISTRKLPGGGGATGIRHCFGGNFAGRPTRNMALAKYLEIPHGIIGPPAVGCPLPWGLPGVAGVPEAGFPTPPLFSFFGQILRAVRGGKGELRL